MPIGRNPIVRIKDHLHIANMTRRFLAEAADSDSRRSFKIYILYHLSPLFIYDYVKQHGSVRKDFGSDVRVRNKFGQFNCGREWLNVYIVSEMSEPQTEPFFDIRKGKRSPVFIDVGAHIGKYSIWMARKGYKVFSFEPNPSTLSILKQNIATNGCQDMVSVTDAALSSKEGKATLYFGLSGHASMEGKAPKAVTIRTLRLDTLNLHPDLMKIDVEGHELEVLKGAVQTIKENHPRLIIETGQPMNKRSEVDPFLCNLGYKCIATQLDKLNSVYEYSNVQKERKRKGSPSRVK